MKIASREELFGFDLRSIALTRIGLGGLILFDLMVRFRDITAFYTDQGLLTIADWKVMPNEDGVWSLHALSGSYEWQLILFGLAGIAAVSMILGYQTKVATIISFILLISLQSRNGLINHNTDVMMRVLLFWGMFLPWGRRFSLDAIRMQTERRKKKPTFGMAFLGYSVQLISIYVFTALLKDGVEWHSEGSAMWYALNIDSYSTEGGRWLVQNGEGYLPFLTRLTWWWELLGFLLLFVPIFQPILRGIGIFLFVGFHVGTGILFDLGHFPAIGIIAWLAIIPGAWWNSRTGRLITVNLRLLFRFTRRAYPKIYRPYAGENLPVQILLAGIMIICFLSNLIGIWNPKNGLNNMLQVVRLDQHWLMFAPSPRKEDGWYSIEGKKSTGEKIELLYLTMGEDATAPLLFEKPQYLSQVYPNSRWAKYFWNLWTEEYAYHEKFLMDYAASQAARSGVQSLKLVHYLEKSEFGAESEIIRQELIEIKSEPDR